MRWGKPRDKWFRWFAWRPVRINYGKEDGRWAWLEIVDRMYRPSGMKTILYKAAGESDV